MKKSSRETVQTKKKIHPRKHKILKHSVMLQFNAELLRRRFDFAVAVAETANHNADEKDGNDEGKDADNHGAAEPRAPGQNLETRENCRGMSARETGRVNNQRLCE